MGSLDRPHPSPRDGMGSSLLRVARGDGPCSAVTVMYAVHGMDEELRSYTGLEFLLGQNCLPI